MHERTAVEKIISWVGSVPSIIFHSCIFACFLLLTLSNFFSRDLVLLVWNTIVSLEAIYLAIFIQFSVNRQGETIKGVEEDVEDIQEDIQDISEDVEDIQEDIEEISEDETEEMRKHHQSVTLETMTKDIQRLLKDLEELKKGQ